MKVVALCIVFVSMSCHACWISYKLAGYPYYPTYYKQGKLVAPAKSEKPFVPYSPYLQVFGGHVDKRPSFVRFTTNNVRIDFDKDETFDHVIALGEGIGAVITKRPGPSHTITRIYIIDASGNISKYDLKNEIKSYHFYDDASAAFIGIDGTAMHLLPFSSLRSDGLIQ